MAKIVWYVEKYVRYACFRPVYTLKNIRYAIYVRVCT